MYFSANAWCVDTPASFAKEMAGAGDNFSRVKSIYKRAKDKDMLNSAIINMQINLAIMNNDWSMITPVLEDAIARGYRTRIHIAGGVQVVRGEERYFTEIGDENANANAERIYETVHKDVLLEGVEVVGIKYFPANGPGLGLIIRIKRDGDVEVEEEVEDGALDEEETAVAQAPEDVEDARERRLRRRRRLPDVGELDEEDGGVGNVMPDVDGTELEGEAAEVLDGDVDGNEVRERFAGEVEVDFVGPSEDEVDTEDDDLTSL